MRGIPGEKRISKKAKKGVDKWVFSWYYMQAASREAHGTEKSRKEFEKSS